MKSMRVCYGAGIILCLLGAAVTVAGQPVFTNLHAFVSGSTSDGADPNALVSDGNLLWGTTAVGGQQNDGMIYSIATNGANFTPVYNFSGAADGVEPNELLLAGGTFFGTTFHADSGSEPGAVYRFDTNTATLTVLHTFTNSPDGAYSYAGLILSGATLYGTTGSGGTNGFGTVFKMATNGANYTLLHQFSNGADGGVPRGRLLLTGNRLYGTASTGGTNSFGTVFSMDTNGNNFSTLYSFSNSPSATTPYVGLTSDGAGLLYGASISGGSSNLGTIFSIGTNGGFTILHTFTNNEALSPQGQLLFSNGVLFGNALAGGTGGGGVTFELATNGANFFTLYNFTNTTTGENPIGSMVLQNNDLFGVTYTSGPNGAGTVFGLQLTPFITQQPQPQNVSVDGSVTMTGGGGGLGTLGYQWYTNGAPVPGATGATLFYSSVTTNQAGNYTLVVTNFAGSVTSNPALLTVSVNPLPNITAQPQSQTVTNGGTANFSVTAVNGSLTYQWYYNTNTLLGGQTGSTLIIPSVAPGNAGAYTVVVANNSGTTTSAPAILTVSVPPLPQITGQPQSQTVTNGGTANFSVTAVNGSLTYQWYYNTNTLLGGQTGSTLSIPSVAPGNAGAYTVVVANNSGTTTSAPAILTVSIPSVPNITSQPQSETVSNGVTASFSVTAVNGSLTYQWYYNTNTLLGGQTGSTLAIPAVTSSNAGAYTVVVANDVGAATSSPAILTVVQVSPFITNQPQSQIISNGNNVTFSVGAIGQGPLYYQWYSNSVNTAIGPALAKMTNATLSFTGVVASRYNGKFFSVVVSNSFGTATSTPAMLSVVFAPVITTNPMPTTVIVSNLASFSVAVLGVNPTYKWYSNSVNTAIGKQITGATSSTYSFTATTNLNNLYYSVVVNNGNGSATSSPPAQLTVITAPVILTNPLPATVSSGGATNFTVSAIGAITLKYQWYLNTNTLLLAQTNSTLLITNASNVQAGYYSVIITNTYGRATSSPALLTISGGLPVITLQPLGVSIPIGSSVTFISSATGPGTLGYEWLYNTNTLIGGANATNLAIVGANQPGYYAMVATNNFGAATSSPALLTLTGQATLLSSAFDPASGSYLFNYLNLAGSTNRLWATTNLGDPNAWQAIATNIMATNGTWNFIDPDTAKTNAERFYRFSTP
ncbi:MAG TPA: immunoglobulin domain-containing protein [Candidatus Sulfotelmatobacter sp.]|jgi:uncharacterized repeat protein (TIGR03803 family)|nr:immunoglobulin domain-containing protein [Candidatus Sulfotelmatobacter sp.]